MIIAVTGSAGLIGSRLTVLLGSGGHRVMRLLRSKPRPELDEVYWDPVRGMVDTMALGRVDAVVHLAGENIAKGRWTTRKKARIRDSRVNGTRVLSEALARLSPPPNVMICASAIGYYGNRGDEWLREESTPGSGFLADVCRQWEAGAEPARQRGIRVVHLRTGVVLSPAGGALRQKLLTFRMGLGGKIGSGRQYLSWIAIDDLLAVIMHALTTDTLQGPVNAVAPNPVTNLEFTRTLGRVLGRPTLFPMPALAARLVFGEMAEELLLASARVQPARLATTGYQFRFPTLDGALRYLLRKKS
ncbi:MAG: TIGR01777 family oxidoreductase [Candidatus Methylomirabilaceae bacterium]